MSIKKATKVKKVPVKEEKIEELQGIILVRDDGGHIGYQYSYAGQGGEYFGQDAFSEAVKSFRLLRGF